MRVQLVVRAVIVAVSLCACSASAGPVSTVASVESSDGPTLFLTGAVEPEDVWAEPSVENRGPAQTAIKKPLDSIQYDEPVPVF